MKWLLDTCVISELVRPKPSQSVTRWLDERDEETLFISVLTVGELERGISRLPSSRKRATLEHWLRSDVTERFGRRLLSIDATVAARWGAMIGTSDARGAPLPVIDSLIAATGLVHDCTVVTRNTRDLDRCGARCFNPWVAQ